MDLASRIISLEGGEDVEEPLRFVEWLQHLPPPCAVHTWECAVHTIRCVVHTWECIVHTITCAFHTLECAVHTMRCVLHTSQCGVHKWECSQYKVRPCTQLRPRARRSRLGLSNGCSTYHAILISKRASQYSFHLKSIHPQIRQLILYYLLL